jgi:hypothetical protein
VSDQDPDDFFDESPKGAGGFVQEWMRKIAVGSLGALFMTEEGLRALAGQLKLPKEGLAYLLAQAEKTKDDLSRVLSEEVRRFLQSDKLRDELVKLVSGMTIEVKAQVRLVPNEQAQKPASSTPEVTVTEIAARRSKKKKE